uniref:Uncharacterized protein n=1 Tax=Ciona intestinalis TaxID=7719 RepID=H2XY99_CIOIN
MLAHILFLSFARCRTRTDGKLHQLKW